MGKENLMFGNIETEKNMYCHHKRPIFLKDLHIEKVLVSSVVKNYKYFIG